MEITYMINTIKTEFLADCLQCETGLRPTGWFWSEATWKVDESSRSS